MVEDKEIKCKTVGHSIFSVTEFIIIIQKHGINAIIDVRSMPYSRYCPQFNREPLKQELAKCQVAYHFLGDYLGARYTDPKVLFPDGKVDFKKVRLLPKFQEGIAKVIEIIKQGSNVALMCTEKDPFDCHRFVLISPALVKKGVIVEHIIDASRSISQIELEKRLLKNYEGSSDSSSNLEKWIPQVKKTGGNRLEELYELRNKDIAFNGIK
nr:DUF488 domain-containing protein [Candidatus Sigynarchaeota archaeon]